MPAEEVARHQLIYTWQRQAQRLRAEGQCVAHIDSFLRRLAQVPGEDVSEISLRWCHRHAEHRPVLVLFTVALMWLAVTLLGPRLGLNPAVALAGLLGLAGVGAFLSSWKSERAFSQELFARAHFSLHCPAFV